MKDEDKKRFDDQLFAPLGGRDPDNVSADVARAELDDFMKLSGEVR